MTKITIASRAPGATSWFVVALLGIHSSDALANGKSGDAPPTTAAAAAEETGTKEPKELGFSWFQGDRRVGILRGYASMLHVRLQPRLSGFLPPPGSGAPSASAHWREWSDHQGGADLCPFAGSQYRAAYLGGRVLDVGIVGDLGRYEWESGWRLSFISVAGSVGLADSGDLVTAAYLFAVGKQRSGVESVISSALPLTVELDFVRVRSPWRWEAFVGIAGELRPFGGELLAQTPVAGLAASWD